MKAAHFVLLVGVLLSATTEAFPQQMKTIPAGKLQSFIKSKENTAEIASFLLDERPVTNGEFLAFVKENPQWSPENIKRIFAEVEYLSHWTPAFVDGTNPLAAHQPVVNVSWFAARAYCQSQGKRLPLMAEWEYAALAPPVDSHYQSTEEIILNWYSRKMPEGAIAGSVYRNSYGVYDLFGLIWEWTENFDRVNFSDDTRNNADIPEGLFCGSAAMNAADASDYATFIRYAFRASLKGQYTNRKLGFRCAKSL